jgi:hypothetical protein
MQALTAAPRDHLTDEQVTGLLTSPALEVSAGCDLLNADLTVREDISDDLLGGRVTYNLYARIHRVCDLSLSRSLTWGVDLVRPFMVLTDGLTGVAARWNVGVFALTTPDRRVGETPETYDVQGYDRLYLLDRPVGDSYEIASGVEYLKAVRDTIAAAGLSGVLLDGSAAGVTLPRAMTWPLVSDGGDSEPVTWLRVVNDLLTPINYRAVWADQDGLFRSGPYVEPTARPDEWTFDADDLTSGIVGEGRSVLEDVWATPNRWVFVRSNLPGDPPPEPTDGAGVYTVNNVDGTVLGLSTPASVLTSQNARGLVWPQVFDYDAASQVALVALGDRRVASDLRSTTKYDLTTGPFPGAGHADIYRYTDAAVGTRKVQAAQWDFDLAGSDVRWLWEAV